MTIKMTAGIIGVVIFLLFLIYIYNKLVRLRYAVRNTWSDIDVHLKKRYDLLPNLVEVVKGYAAHESETFAKIARLRTAAMNAQTPVEKAKADNLLTQNLKSFFAVAEAYPELKANKNFKEIMLEMKDIEDNIEQARRYYNASVREFNIAASVFPTNIIASAFSFKPEEFFSLENAAAERQPIKAGF
ncbi:MAG TPA: LemA family protein [Smithella sp.]|nr:LemA family protein [Smithella sp.]MDM7988386.1 LemA family protein [Smithella sp.]HNY49868.1 LemA family protein [Smithella sp.]HOG89680.1 LemA family protein [Smithella sp.]HOU50706.1 LemA family protein [Smithella sp.]